VQQLLIFLQKCVKQEHTKIHNGWSELYNQYQEIQNNYTNFNAA